MTRTLSRRHLLQGAGAGAAGLLAAPALVAQTGSGTEITFAFAQDETGAVQELIDGFNGQGDVQVTWQKAPDESDAFFDMITERLGGGSEIDVFGCDVIWTAELAAQGLIADVSGRIYEDLEPGDMLSAALDSTFYRNRLYAVPWFSDVGMLYYRRDLLFDANLQPPETWDEVASAANQIREQADIQHGMVLQGANYEGGTVNGLEWIWSAGGRAWTPASRTPGSFGAALSDADVVVLNSQATVAGLQKAREFVDQGIVPQQVAEFNERDSLDAFGQGNAVFMRNWPFAYRLLGTQQFGNLSLDQVGITRIPTLNPDRTSYGCLGGWNLAMAAGSQNQDAVWQFITYAVAEERQRNMARTGSYLPTLSGLYGDQQLKQQVPVVRLGEEAVRTARKRPTSTNYSQLSPHISSMFNNVLTGEAEPQDAVLQAQQALRETIAQRG